MTRNFLQLFPAFKYRNYRIFFSAQTISLTGHWMQQVAQGYLVFQLTHSAFMVGLIAAIAQLPALFFTLIGGALADRFPKKNILRISQFIQFILASTLGILTITGNVNLVNLAALAFLMGLVSSIDQPTRISIITQLVNREDLHAATAINMSIFNSARIVGPAIAGWLIAVVGVGWAFLLNGISYIAPFIAYNFIRFAPHVPRPHPGTFRAIKLGIKYAASHRIVKLLLIYLGIISVFGWSYATLLPVIAEKVFSQGPQGLGYLYSLAGAGSVLGAVSVSAYTRRYAGAKLILFGGLLYSTALVAFSLTKNFELALMLLFLTGFGITTQNSTIQATIQTTIEDKFRGRVSSLQAFMLMGMHPIGSFQIGTVAEHFGSQMAVRAGGIIVFLSAILLYLRSPKT